MSKKKILAPVLVLRYGKYQKDTLEFFTEICTIRDYVSGINKYLLQYVHNILKYLSCFIRPSPSISSTRK